MDFTGFLARCHPGIDFLQEGNRLMQYRILLIDSCCLYPSIPDNKKNTRPAKAIQPELSVPIMQRLNRIPDRALLFEELLPETESLNHIIQTHHESTRMTISEDIQPPPPSALKLAYHLKITLFSPIKQKKQRPHHTGAHHTHNHPPLKCRVQFRRHTPRRNIPPSHQANPCVPERQPPFRSAAPGTAPSSSPRHTHP
jgi:hypothetical protein